MKPKILITNDDGIDAPGIWHLWSALHEFADVTIVAPSVQMSGASLGLTLHEPITRHSVKWDKEAVAIKLRGTPADCVRFGLKMVLEEKPDLVVSGINQGSNSGRSALYSGTIGGVIEAAMKGVPGIAFSSVSHETPRYEVIEPYVLPIVEHILDYPMNPGTILNVNFPSDFESFAGVRMARQGKSLWVEEFEERTHPDGAPYYWHGGQWREHEEVEESDVALLEKGFVTAVPIHVDELTDREFFQSRKKQFESNFV